MFNNVYVGYMFGVKVFVVVLVFFLILFFFIVFIIGFGFGVVVLIGQVWGVKKFEVVKIVVGIMLLVGFIVGLVVVLLGGLFVNVLLGWFGMFVDIL